MAITNTISNRWKLAQMSGEVHCREDVFKVALMTPAFTFDPDSHAQWSQVSGEEIVAGNGYVAGGQALVSGELSQNNATDQASMVWLNNYITATGGSIANSGAAIIYDDSHAEDLIMGCADFGVDYEIANGMSLKLNSIILKW